MAKNKATAAAVKADPVIDDLTGVDVTKVNPHVLDRYLGIFCPGQVSGAITTRLHRLHQFFVSKAPADATKPTDEKPLVCSTCDVCHGSSDIRLACCPYCGDAETDGEAPDEEAGIRALGGGLAVGAAAGEKLVPVPKGAERKRKRIGGAEPAQGELPNVGGTQAAPADEEAPSGPSSATTAIVMATPVDIEPEGFVATEDAAATVEELDRAVGRVHEIYKGGYGTLHDLGRELAPIFGRKLWLQRRHEGKVAYTSWREFVEAEIPISLGYSYQLMDVAMKFDRETFLEIGPAKLAWLLKVPEAERGELLAQAKTQTLAGLKTKVTEIAGGKTRDTGRKGFKGTGAPRGRPKGSTNKPKPGAPAPEPTRKAPPAEKGMTVALSPGKVKIPLFKRTAKDVRCKRLADDPWGEETLPNGTVIRYIVSTNTAGEMYIQREVREGKK